MLHLLATKRVVEIRDGVRQPGRVPALCLLLILAISLPAAAQDIRERIRLKNRDAAADMISESQRIDVTLTLSATATRQIQQIVRTGGTIDSNRKVVTATVGAQDASVIKVGQRARAFAPESKSSMFQARVTRIVPLGAGSQVDVTLAGVGLANSRNYVVEITAELGEFLSVPNEAIIEEGDRRVVYVEKQKGRYIPHEIQGGIQGELYTEVLSGVKDGDQVVTFGSFFIDSEYKLKLAGSAASAP
jgi:hypothetical protein